MSVLPAYNLCTMCVKYFGGHKRALILGNWSYRWFLDAKWVLGTEPGSSKKVLLTMESSFLQLLI